MSEISDEIETKSVKYVQEWDWSEYVINIDW